MKFLDICVLSALLGLCCAGHHVDIEYVSPFLTLTLNDLGPDGVLGVDFHYVINKELVNVTGTSTRDGWQYTTSVKLKDGDYVMAYADIYKETGSNVSTEGCVFIYNETNHISEGNNTALPPKQLNGAVVFRDDFNSLNTDDWRHEVSMFGGGNGEFEVYTNDPKNSFVKNGYLYIKPTLTVDDSRFDAPNFLHTGVMDMKALFGSCTQSKHYGCHRRGKHGLLPPIMSGKLKSNPTLRYGVVEVRARIPSGDWLWPAIWMMPRDSVYGGWPRSGEIDIMESRGNEGQFSIGTVSSTFIWGPSWKDYRARPTHGELKSSNWGSEFHVWRLEWSPTHAATYIDDVKIVQADPGNGGFWKKGGFHGTNIWESGDKMAPFDQEFYVIFNVAVGGTNGYFPDNGTYKNKPWKNRSGKPKLDFWNGRKQWLPTWKGDDVAMLVDYVEMRQW